MDNLSIIKEFVSLDTVLNIPIGKTSICPFCNKKKFFLANKVYGKCFRSSCKANKSFFRKDKLYIDIIDYFALKENISNISEVYAYIIQYLNNSSDIEFSFSEYEEMFKRRDTTFKRVISTYHQTLFEDWNKPALEYLLNRGLSKEVIRSNLVGYAPSPNFLRYKGFSKEELKLVELYDEENNKEYFSKRIIFPIKDEDNNFVHLQGRWLGDIPENFNIPRYKSTKNILGIKSIDSCLYQENRISSYLKELYITEGVPDCLTLINKRINAVGIFGLNNLNKHLNKFKKFERIYILGDNDRFEDNHQNYSNQFKSWRVLIPQIISLQLMLPEIEFRIWMPPLNNLKIKDINDLDLYLNRSKNNLELKTLINKYSVDIIDIFNPFFSKKSYIENNVKKYHDFKSIEDTFRLISITKRKEEIIEEFINNNSKEEIKNCLLSLFQE